jgi:Yip1 domain
MSTTPISDASNAAAPAPIGAIGRMSGVLISPRPTYENIVARPSWFAPLAVLCVLSIAIIAVFSQRVGWRGFLERQFEKNPRTANMPPDQRELALDRAVKVAPPFTYAAVAIGTFLYPVIAAAVLLGAFNLLAGARLNFETVMGIVSYSWMPFFIAGVLAMILLFLKSPDSIDLEHLVASNPGAFISDDSPKWMMTLLTSLDIFTFWVLILQGIGFSAANPKKVSFAKGLTIVVAVWAIYVLAKVAWVGAFS